MPDTVNDFDITSDTVIVPPSGTMLYNIKLNTYDTSSGRLIPTDLASIPVVNLVNSYGVNRSSRVTTLNPGTPVTGTGQYVWLYTSTAGDGLESLRFNLSNAPDTFRGTTIFTAWPLTTLSGPGTIPTPITVVDNNNVPVSNANVWITTDAAGINVIAGTLTTKYNGTTDPFLLWPGTYYYWAQKYGIISAQGVQFTVS